MAKRKSKDDAREMVDMITEDDEVMGAMSKKEAERGNLLKRAVSVMVFNDKGELFVQKCAKMASGKEKDKGCWGISCFGCLRSGEAYDDAACRELKESLGLDAPCEYVCKFRYKDAKLNCICHLFTIQYELDVPYDKKAISEAIFVGEGDMQRMISEGKFSKEAEYLIVNYYKLAKELAME